MPQGNHSAKSGDPLMPYQGIRRKVFVSFHQNDRAEVDQFLKTWCDTEQVFIPKILGASDNDDFINSTNPEYVMSQIRAKYLGDSTVTIVLVGKCTHSRRYVDWELKASLRQARDAPPPNGVMGIILPSQGSSAHLPDRLAENWEQGHGNCYARYWTAPTTAEGFGTIIEDAFNARTARSHLIKNSQEMFKNNAVCKKCKITH